jgi:hypothetical protein
VYNVTNTGNVTLTITGLSDDKLGDLSPANYVTGDVNSNNQLDVGETWTYIANSTAIAGPYNNNATVNASSPLAQ